MCVRVSRGGYRHVHDVISHGVAVRLLGEAGKRQKIQRVVRSGGNGKATSLSFLLKALLFQALLFHYYYIQ